jgi:sarcosine oxidase
MFDAIVVGLGAMGSSSAYHLSRRHSTVLGLDLFTPPHSFGSSHGKSRIIREAYFENPLYVPLVQRAYRAWADLEAASGRQLLTRTGGLMMGAPDGAVVSGARASAVAHGLSFSELTARELRLRAPAWHPDEQHVAIWEPRAGILAPEAIIEEQLRLARGHGADLRFDEPVLSWRATASGVEVATARDTHRAARLVISAGAWTHALVPDLELPLTVERNVVYWFTPAAPTRAFDQERFPIFIHEYAPGLVWYGFPDLGDGVKLALHHQGETTTADSVRRTVSDEELAIMRSLARRYLPEADGPLRDFAVCLYTNTPDGHFVLGMHPAHPAVIVASPCSGHGFKFSSAIGEIVADLVLEGHTGFDLAPFGVGRFTPAH